MTTLTKITLCYIGGILIGDYMGIPPFYLWRVIGLLSLIAAVFFILRFTRTTTLILFSTFILIGSLFYELAREPAKSIPTFRSKYPVEITGTIIRDPDVRGHETILVLRPEEVIAREHIPPIKGFVQVRIRWPRATFGYGERIKLSSGLWTLRPPKANGDSGYWAYLKRQKIYWLMKMDGSEWIERLGEGKINPIMELATHLKGRISAITRETLPHPSDLVLEGIMLGERSNLPYQIQGWFDQVGVGHILAASGLHVGFVLFIFLGLFHKVLRLPLKGSICLSILFVILYALITGARPAVVRASIMATVVLTSYLLDRETSIYHGLALAALIILIINPLVLFDLGFQLSFGATLGIIALAPPLGNHLKRFLWDWLAMPLAVSISAQLSLWPLLVYYFNQLSLIAVVANLVIVPLAALGVAFGFAGFGVGLVSLELAKVVGLFGHFVLVGLVNSAHLLSLTPYASIYLPQPPILLILGYYLILVIFRVLIGSQGSEIG